MHEEINKIEETAEHFKRYLNAKVSQIKLSVAERFSDMLSVLIAKALAGFVFFFFILFASLAAADGLADYFGKTWMGFLVVGGFYFLLGLLIWFARERLLRIPIMNGILRRLFTTQTEDDEKN